MTWRELVFEICNKIPDEQFDDEAKMVLIGTSCDTAEKLVFRNKDWYETEGGLSYFPSFSGQEPIIKQGEWTIE